MSNNIFVLEESSSDETDTSSEEEEIKEIKDLNQEFLNQTKVLDYEKNRNKLFTKDIEKRIIVVDSHNLFQSSSFKSSNYKIIFDNDTINESSNYDIFSNVIGFKLLRANIRSPPYNVNNTNNVIYYTIGVGTETSLTINPGLYTTTELASVFSVTTNTSSHYISASVFTVTYFDSNDASSGGANDGKGLRYKIAYGSPFTIHWGKNNVSRGAARLFGFFADDITTADGDLFSNKTPDISSHYVDLVIPEIPSKACKFTAYGKGIIERIPFDVFHGEYVHHERSLAITSENYFFPIKLHQLSIELYSQDKEIYDSNNSDNFFEFEITIVNNLNLLK